MRYEKMLPYQLREALANQTPVVFAIGVLEYHAEHLSFGVDTHIITRTLELFEAQNPQIIILPAWYYGSSSYAVAAPENNGTIHIDSLRLEAYAEDFFNSLLRIGFRNIHGISFHQSENFTNGMPTDLAVKLASRRAIFAFLEKSRGEGWWGDESMKEYYQGNDPFGWIKIHPLGDESICKEFPPDHAGVFETSLMMFLAEEEVSMAHHSDQQWYGRQALSASREYGKKIVDAYLKRLQNILK